MIRHLVSLFAAACAARPAPQTPSPSPAAPPPAAPPPAAPTRAVDFTYDASQPLDVQLDGAPDAWDSIEIQRLSYASPRGGRVPALLVVPHGVSGRRPAVIFQHGMGFLDKTELLPDAILVARAGGVALLVDAPDQRPEKLRMFDYAKHEHDDELWEHAAVDLRRAVDVLAARPDVDAQHLGFVGHSFGGTQGAILSAIEPRIHAFVLVGAGDFTRGIREGQTEALIAVRRNVPPRALEGFLSSMAVFDSTRYLRKAPASAAVFMQFGAYDAGTSQRADDELAAASTARTTTRRYPTGHFITSPEAVHDRIQFLVEELHLPGRQ
jgi:dienelactone hydrolase